jgi:hypothetical protein
MMKKTALLFITILGILAFLSCEKELRDPKLDMSQTQSGEISEPASGTAFILTADEVDNVMTTFKWSETQYNLGNLETTNYSLQMDAADSNFTNPTDLVTGTELMFEITVGEMNKTLKDLGYPANEQVTMEFRVRSFKNDVTTITEAFSETIILTFTPYEDVVVTEKFIYILGSGTTIGWDNLLALPMTMIGDGVFARVELLTAGADQFIKFITTPGYWAPQWGTDATGTAEEGPLVYRPTEEVDDPAAIPVAEETGNYYIEADTINLTYWTFLTSGELYLVGDASTAGWDNAAGLPFTEVEPHIFEITTTLADGGMKFLEVPGAWAPQWGTDADGTGTGGKLVYRPTESVEDPAEVPSPGAGSFKIRVDLTTMAYTIEAQ